jgi:hypothetical protein
VLCLVVFRNVFLVFLVNYVELGLVTLKCGPLKQDVFMMTKEKKTKGSRDHRNSRGLA